MKKIIVLTGRGPYLGALVPIPPARAADALGVFRDEMRARALHPAGAWSMTLPGGRLLISDGGEPIEAPLGTHAWPLRRLVGSLSGPRARFRIELELTPWSDDRSELGIRPIGRWPPVVWSSTRYYALAEQALLTLTSEIIDWDGARSAVAGAA